MNLKDEKDQEYLEKKNNMSPIVKELFKIIVLRGIDNTIEIGNILYEKEDIDDKKKRDNVRQNRKQMYDLFLGKVKSDKNKGYSRDEKFVNYIMMNEPILLHPKLKKKYGNSNFKNENRSIPLEPNSPNRLPLKARTKNRTIVTLVDYLDEKCWNGGRLYKIKGSEKAGKTTEMKAFIQLCQDRGVKEIIAIDFSNIYSYTLKDAGSFMNWFMNKIYENFKDKSISEIDKRRINEDPCDGSYEYMRVIVNKIYPIAKDNFLLIIIDNIDKLFDYPDIANIFYLYLRKVFQNIKEIRQVITYLTESYLKIDDLHSPFNIGKSLTLCGFDLKDIQKLLELNNVELRKQDIKILLDYIGTSPYLWQITIPYLKESEFEIEDFKKKAIADEEFRGFFYRICNTIEKDEQLLDSTIKLLEPDAFLEKPKIRISYILEGLGVIKRDLQDWDRWIISGGIYRDFLKNNLTKKNKSTLNLLLPEDYKIYVKGESLISYPEPEYEKKPLPTVNLYGGKDGGYIACYSRDREKSVCHVGGGIHLIGQIRLQGQYKERIFEPKGYEGKDISAVQKFKDLCHLCFPDVKGDIWAGGDTGGWFEFPSLTG